MLNRPTSNSFTLSEQERLNCERMADYSSESLPEVWSLAAQRFAQIPALKDPHAKPEVVITYAQMYQQIQQFAAGLQALGVQPGERVALIADNSPRWMIADQGIMASGAVDVVRSAQAEREELLFILADSGSTALVVEDIKTLKKLRESLSINLVVLLSDEEPAAAETLKVLNFSALMALGSKHTLQPVNQNRETLATLIYTSGTSGKPKGVMLTHGNLLHQVTTFGTILPPKPGDRVLSVLPSWHAYERTCEYFILSQGCTQIYTNIRYLKQDLKEFKPQLMVGVPRLWESIYEGVQKQFREQPASKQKLVNFLLNCSQRYIKARRTFQGLNLENLHPSITQKLISGIQTVIFLPLHALGEKLVYKKVREATGGELKRVISGGGSLAKHLDNFFEIIDIEVLVGYGLTETSPVTNVRRPWHNLRGSSGQPIPGTEIRIVDLETRQPLPIEQRGLVMARGPQIMRGYWQNPEATAKAIDPQGWFDTGDIGWVTQQNDLVVTGRAKDTIVLTNGENIEPTPIEDACLRSPYIAQIMLVGQDQRSLGALIVPNLEALQQWASAQNLQLPLPDETRGQGDKETRGQGDKGTRGQGDKETRGQGDKGTRGQGDKGTRGQGDKGTRGEGETSYSSQEIDLDSKVIQDLFRQELNREVQNRPGYRADDRIGAFKLILEPFSIENGLMTQTLKIRRNVVMERYHDIINGMFA